MRPDIDDIKDAAARLDGIANRTPLVEFDPGMSLPFDLFLKLETGQQTGSFKFRGAYNRISRLSDDEKQRGVAAYSSGNHAQAVASVAKILKIPAVIVMPRDAPAVKIESTRNYGAEIVLYDRWTESREGITRDLAAERGLTIVPPFDDPHIIAGQGTAGLEIAEDCRALGIVPDFYLSPCSGGGLISGCAIAIKGAFPDCAVYCVEPDQYDDTARSLQSGRREKNEDKPPPSICDALLVQYPGEITFPIMSELLAGGYSVSDDEVRAAINIAWDRAGIVLEPGGAAALAAALREEFPAGANIVVMCSGANIDPDMFRTITGAAPPAKQG